MFNSSHPSRTGANYTAYMRSMQDSAMRSSQASINMRHTGLTSASHYTPQANSYSTPASFSARSSHSEVSSSSIVPQQSTSHYNETTIVNNPTYHSTYTSPSFLGTTQTSFVPAPIQQTFTPFAKHLSPAQVALNGIMAKQKRFFSNAHGVAQMQAKQKGKEQKAQEQLQAEQARIQAAARLAEQTRIAEETRQAQIQLIEQRNREQARIMEEMKKKKKEKEEQIKLGNHYVVNKEFYSPRGSSLSLPNKTILLSPTKEPEQMDKTILFGFWATTTAEKIRDLSESIVKMQLKDGSIARDVEYIIDVAKIERTISLAKQMKKIEEFKKSMDVIVEKIKEEEKLSTDKRIYIVNNHNYYSPRGSELSCPDGVVFFSVAKEIENISKKDMLEFWANTSTEKIKLLFEKLILNGLEVGLLKKNIAYAIDLENIEKTITAAMQMSATSSSSFSAGSSSSACSSSSSSSNSEDEPEDEQDEDKECNYNYRKIFEGADNGIIDGLVEEGIIGGIMGALNGAVEGGLEALDEKCLCENKSKLPPETKSALRKFAITTIFSHHKGKKLLKELTTQSIVGYMSEKLGLKIDTSPNEDSSLNCNIIAKQIVEDVLNNAMIATMLTRNIRVVAGASIVGVFTGTLKGLNKAVYQAQQYKKEKEHENSPPKARPF